LDAGLDHQRQVRHREHLDHRDRPADTVAAAAAAGTESPRTAFSIAHSAIPAARARARACAAAR
ncbi:hypothetical protein, partial [Mycobacterium kyorinense]|uniref:hypothetical protein n=1 Tax=Mycobacterium kyorinense TaxID=487514 RepID=UPI001E3EB5A2